MPTRRSLLLSILGAVGTLQLGGATENVRLTPLVAALSRMCREPNSARRLGLAYLRCRPSEAHPDALIERLLAFQETSPSTAPDRLKTQLRDQSRHDFASNRIVRVDGWILSETEARLCALTALLSS